MKGTGQPNQRRRSHFSLHKRRLQTRALISVEATHMYKQAGLMMQWLYLAPGAEQSTMGVAILDHAAMFVLPPHAVYDNDSDNNNDNDDNNDDSMVTQIRCFASRWSGARLKNWDIYSVLKWLLSDQKNFLNLFPFVLNWTYFMFLLQGRLRSNPDWRRWPREESSWMSRTRNRPG